MQDPILRILLWPFGSINEYGEFYPNVLGQLIISLLSLLTGVAVTVLVIGSIITALIIVGDGVEGLRMPELFRDPLCFLLDRCN